MYSTTDFRKGLKIEVEGTPYEIVDFQHFKPGKGGAMVRTKLRNVESGSIVENSFKPGEKFERIVRCTLGARPVIEHAEIPDEEIPF